MKRVRSGRRERRSRALLFRILIFVLEILLVVILAYGVSTFFLRSVTMRENSMEPTISSGDTLLMNTLAYRFGSPGRRDIIAYRNTDEEAENLHIKRIIGIPGDTVQIVNGQIVLNGETYLDETFPAMVDPGLAIDPITLGDDEYFVLGDNRNGSEDSRYASVGNVRKKRIAGKIWLRTWPIGKFGGLK
ncbi:MAG: signal peptidase I [Eubacterium sp.]|nr:signal peptidase I [Eubacterium sp.]